MTIAELWDAFASSALAGPKLSELERGLMRTAFYAGCWTLLEACAFLTRSGSDEEAAHQLSAWAREVATYLDTQAPPRGEA